MRKKNIPSRWKISDSYKDKLVFNVDKSLRIVSEFKNKIEQTVNGENIFKSMAELIDKLTDRLDTLTGKPHILDCDGNIVYYSELTSVVSSQLLHYFFIVLLNNITTKSLTLDSERVSRIMKNKMKFHIFDLRRSKNSKNEKSKSIWIKNIKILMLYFFRYQI